MKPTLKERLMENTLIYLGLTLVFAALIFYGLLEMLISQRQPWMSESLVSIFRVIQDSGMLFIFALGAATSLSGIVYACVKTWQRIKAPESNYDDTPEEKS